jgi:hypothetical protein
MSASTREAKVDRSPPSVDGNGSAEQLDTDDRIEPIEVVAATTPAAMAEGLQFCAEKYQETYSAHWIATPDILFIARRGGRVVSTAGVELGSRRPQIDSERYFLLSPGMRAFIDRNRSNLGEFGRFSSDDPAGTKAVIHRIIAFGRQSGIDFFFAWANPAVYTYVSKHVGLPLAAVDVPVNAAAVHMDTTWTAPPVNFFLREDPPRLLVGVVPFLDVAYARLSEEYGSPSLLM